MLSETVINLLFVMVGAGIGSAVTCLFILGLELKEAIKEAHYERETRDR